MTGAGRVQGRGSPRRLTGGARVAAYTPSTMDRRSAFVLLAVLAAAAFLAGLELMVTAVALPAIVVDLADWTALRRASWIVNGYLLATVVTMPLAGRLSDRWGARRLLLAGLGLFTLGSLLAGMAGSLETLVGARVVQAVGGGILVPVATAAASHLFAASGRPRALGTIGAATFLGMAAGPFVGAWVIGTVHPSPVIDAAGLEGPIRAILEPAWRYVFYLNVPIGVAAIALAWAASAAWESPRRPGPIDLPGAAALAGALAILLGGLTMAGSEDPVIGEPGSWTASLIALAVAAVLVRFAVRLGRRHADPFLDPGAYRVPAFRSAAVVSLLTGYGLATAIIGGAVFVDRVLYGGPDVQRLTLGALAAATAVGALGSGFVLHRFGPVALSVGGLALSAVALAVMSTWSPETAPAEAALAMGMFGLGFGLTVTPRSTAAVEALGRSAFGIASATVTVARMIGMAVGLAALTAFGATTIDRLTREVYATPDAYRAIVPAALRDRPLTDGLVVDALEAWAADEAARILVGVFLVAAAVTIVAILPAVRLGRRRILATEEDDPVEPGAALSL